MIEYTEKDMWRTLVRVLCIDGYWVWFVVPAWGSSAAVRLDANDLPRNICAALEVDKRFHAMCNIGCDDIRNLRFEKWEE